MQACHLSAKKIACRRGERLLFRGLDLGLDAGSACHIAGPNGIGKTSLLRILGGLLKPYSGTIQRTGAAALLDEKPALDPQSPLWRALAFWAELDGAPKREKHPAHQHPAHEHYADRVGLHDLLDVPVRFLSTGQRKRAGLARMLGQQAPIWLLDEPLNGLDREGAALTENCVAEHCAAGGIAVVASHQPINLPAPLVIDLEGFVP